MKITSKNTRVATVVLAALALVTAALVPGFAGAKSSGKTLQLKSTGGTTLKLDAGTASALTGLGVSVAPISPAKAGSKGITFPITGGKVNSKTLAGNIKHSGGLRLSAGSTVVDLKNFTINIDSKPDLVATVGTARVSILSLDLSKLKNNSSGKNIKLSGVKGSLTQAAADALNGAFGTTAFTKGLVLGVASVNAKVK
ncbi:MAG: HtaA domain-containing protein [Thermoleophilaceae bacterium]|nr:HtaA domain-containing protein [Thermoleophilaceae bacterium]